MGKLTTYVLDTARGVPAVGMRYALYHIGEGDTPTLICGGQTNNQGRTDEPLMKGKKLTVGQYQLIFAVGTFFRELGYGLPDPSFLEKVPIFFNITDANKDYHIPLLVSPYSYSTHRG